MAVSRRNSTSKEQVATPARVTRSQSRASSSVPVEQTPSKTPTRRNLSKKAVEKKVIEVIDLDEDEVIQEDVAIVEVAPKLETVPEEVEIAKVVEVEPKPESAKEVPVGPIVIVEQSTQPVKLDKPEQNNKSGRWWKDVQTGRHSSIVKVKTFKSSWERKMAEKARKNQVKLFQTDIRDRKKQEQEEKLQRKKEQEARRLENERKGEIVQVITKAHKLKKTKKKQLRMIQKRDTSGVAPKVI